ncbi:hypothetical protein JOC70_003530 [Clostridium pascui]|nr:hypothetical protein [Clostridium pascui]
MVINLQQSNKKPVKIFAIYIKNYYNEKRL